MNKLLLFLTIFFISNIYAENKNINFDLIEDKKKQRIIFFHMNNCGYCNRMKQITLKDVKIQKTVQTNFTFSNINIDESDTIIFNNKTYTNKDFAHKLEVNFYPTVLFLDSKNEIVYKARGFRSTEKFQHILNFMITDAFEEMSFFEYLENIKKRKGDKE